MLPRRLIIEETYSVKQALLTRYPSNTMNMCSGAEELIRNIDLVVFHGNESLKLQQEIEHLRAMRNKISADFPKAPADEKQKLREQINLIKGELERREFFYEEAEKAAHYYESMIPNLPSSDVPLCKDFSVEYEKYIRAILTMLHAMILYEY